jgi:hypothetical protein
MMIGKASFFLVIGGSKSTSGPLIDSNSYSMTHERNHPLILFGQFAAVDFPLNLNLPELLGLMRAPLFLNKQFKISMFYLINWNSR